MKIAVVGSRKLCGVYIQQAICKYLDDNRNDISEIVSGGAMGPDSIAEAWAVRNNVKTTIFRPDWKKYGKAAGMIRNKDIIKACDKCIAFWDGESKGTKGDIDLCKKYDKPVQIFTLDVNALAI